MNRLKQLVVSIVCSGSLACCQAQGVNVQTTNTQAVLSYVAPADGSPCSLEVSTRSSFQTLVHDVNPALFAGADRDDRPGNTFDGSTRRFVIGKRGVDKASDGRLHSRALEAATRHYYRLRCNDDTISGTFDTQNLPSGDSFPELPPFHAEGFGNYGWPTLDWSDRNRQYVDPMTGVVVKLATGPGDWGNRTEGTFLPEMYVNLSDGWSNPGNITSGSASRLATTSNASSPIFAAIDGKVFPPGTLGGFNPITTTDDLGIRIYGSGSDGDAANRTIQVCLSVDSGQSCHTDALDVVLPRGGATDAGVMVPSNFPAPGFAGWRKVVSKEFLPTVGKVNVSDGVVTSVKNGYGAPTDTGSMFAANLRTGSKIRIAGSAPACPQNLCTVKSVRGSREILISESQVSLSEADFTLANFGVRIVKATGIGTVSVSARYTAAWSFGWILPVTGATDQCSRREVTANVDADGNPLPAPIRGYLCVLPNVASSSGLYFFSTDTGDSRLLSVFRTPESLPGHQAEDFPANPVYAGPMTGNFDPDNPRVIYINSETRNRKRSAFRITYTGDFRALRYNYPPGGGGEQPRVPEDNLLWENINKPSANRDLQAQIDARFPEYDKARFGDISREPGRSVSGRYMAFVKNIGLQDSPCWVFLLNIQSGEVERAFNTYDGKFHPTLRWAGCHYADASPIPDSVTISNVVLRAKNPNSNYQGPFQTRVTSLKRASGFTQDTSLTWPINNSYDNSCPSDIPDSFKVLGAVGNRCVTLRVEGEPCSAFASAAEKQWSPCPWDASRSMLQTIEPGDLVTDIIDPRPGIDSERLRVVKKTVLGREIELVLQRNASTVYCTIPAGLEYQGQHANGWQLTMAPAGETCESGILYVNGATGDVRQENRFLLGGHFDLGTGRDEGTFSFVGLGYSVRYNYPFERIGERGAYTVAMDPKFEGLVSFPSGNMLQSYSSIRQWTAPPEERRWMLDFRHMNGPFGAGAEATGLSIGSPVSATAVEGTAQVYRLNILGLVDYKRLPLLSFAGRHLLLEKSSPVKGNTLEDTDAWRFCYAYTAGECREGSEAGQAFVVVPNATFTGRCSTAQYTQNAPCVITAHPVGGWATQVDVSQPDPVGKNFRRLTMAFSGPGRQYTFANLRATPNGKWAFIPGFWLDGLRQDLLAIKLPPFALDTSRDRTRFVSIPVEVPKVDGAAKAWVEFGYAENGPPQDFLCTRRQDPCVASRSTASNPFQFASETSDQTAVPCADGCVIDVPAVAARVLYYRIRYLGPDSDTVAFGPVQVRTTY